jgi:hypothetical protein
LFVDDEDLTCNICDRAFGNPTLLNRHQIKYRHWGYVVVHLKRCFAVLEIDSTPRPCRTEKRRLREMKGR